MNNLQPQTFASSLFMGLVGSPGSKHLTRLQLSCQLGVHSSEGLLKLEDFLPNSRTQQLA
jgi:hypothetical protein